MKYQDSLVFHLYNLTYNDEFPLLPCRCAVSMLLGLCYQDDS